MSHADGDLELLLPSVNRRSLRTKVLPSAAAASGCGHRAPKKRAPSWGWNNGSLVLQQAPRCGFKARVRGKVQTSEAFPSNWLVETVIVFGWGLKAVELESGNRECEWDVSVHSILIGHRQLPEQLEAQA